VPPSRKATRVPAKRQVKASKTDNEIVADAGNEIRAAHVFGCADCLLGWLATNINERLKVFSGSTQDTDEQGRKNQTSKTAKITYYIMVADAVFSVDEDETVHAEHTQHPKHCSNLSKMCSQVMLSIYSMMAHCMLPCDFFRLRKRYSCSPEPFLL
jgi:hypothetical protein